MPIKLVSLLGVLFALAVGYSVYRAGLDRGRAELAAAVGQERAACIADSRDLAVRTAQAYSSELEAAYQRTVAAVAGQRASESRLAVASAQLAGKLREITDAKSRLAAACFPDQLRLRIDAAAEAIDRDPSAGADGRPPASDAMLVPVPGHASSRSGKGLRIVAVGDVGRLWGLRAIPPGMRLGTQSAH